MWGSCLSSRSLAERPDAEIKVGWFSSTLLSASALRVCAGCATARERETVRVPHARHSCPVPGYLLATALDRRPRHVEELYPGEVCESRVDL